MPDHPKRRYTGLRDMVNDKIFEGMTLEIGIEMERSKCRREGREYEPYIGIIYFESGEYKVRTWCAVNISLNRIAATSRIYKGDKKWDEKVSGYAKEKKTP